MSSRPACDVKSAALDSEVAAGALDGAKMAFAEPSSNAPSTTGSRPGYSSGSSSTS